MHLYMYDYAFQLIFQKTHFTTKICFSHFNMLNCTKSLISHLFCSWKYEKSHSNQYTRYFATLNYVEFWKSKELSREITMASKIPIWLFLKGFGYILINNPAQQGLHHHYLVKRLKELPFPMKSMTLMHRLSFHEFHILYSYLCKPFFYSVISSQKKFIEFFLQFDTNKHTQRKSLYGAQGLPR